MARPDPFATAIDVLDERGWRQGTHRIQGVPGQPLCMVEAVGDACFQIADGTAEFEALDFASLNFLRLAYGEVSAAVRFNDASATSEEDVKLALKRLSGAWQAVA